MTKRPAAAPRGLGKAGRRLWRQIAAQVEEDGRVCDARELAWLELAAREYDALAGLEGELDALVSSGGSLTTKGSMGQLVTHPHLGECRRSRQVIAQTLARLNLDDPAAVSGSGTGSGTTSTIARAAAMARRERFR